MTDPAYRDVFEPVLVTPNPLSVSDEQKDFIREILRVSSSDSRFAMKAYGAIMKVLLDEALVPIIESIDPTEGHAGGSPLAVTITGQNFEPASAVLQAGSQIASTFVNANELNATVLLSGAIEGTLAISVRNSTGLTSNVVNLDVLPPESANDVAKKQSGITFTPAVVVTRSADESGQVPEPTDSELTEMDRLRAQIASYNEEPPVPPSDDFTPVPTSDATGDSGHVSAPENQFDAGQQG